MDPALKQALITLLVIVIGGSIYKGFAKLVGMGLQRWRDGKPQAPASAAPVSMSDCLDCRKDRQEERMDEMRDREEFRESMRQGLTDGLDKIGKKVEDGFDRMEKKTSERIQTLHRRLDEHLNKPKKVGTS